ncbi:MAG: tail fiber domain-containing protein, partial [Verrucomicrobia bacterium]|nr:tail fiber domain-containing protein [Verrucomicrobiota bacterium]
TGDKISLYGTGTNHYGLGIQSGLLQIHGSTAGADIAFGYGSSTNFTEQMRIKGNGNVGIGTAAPAYPLDVRADQAVGRFLSTNGAEVSVLVLGNTAATARWLGAINFNSSSGNPGQISYATNTGLTFDAGGVERLRITPDGGVGIGTSDPAGAALNVAGTVRATQFQGGGAGLTGVIPADNSVTSAKILNGAILNADLADNSVNADKIADGSVTSLKIADNAVAAVDLASEVASLHKVSGGHLTVDAVGNVGLGVSTPGFPLNFASTSGDKISLYGTSTNHYGLGIQAGLLQIHGSTASADIAFGYGSSANFTEQMRIQGNGNIGIGTNDPQATLHVRGDLLVESATVAKLGALRVELGNSTAGANYATAMGHSTADGSYSTAMGASTANGNYSTALGYSTASGSYATALGTSTAQGTGATALGYLSAATTNYSLAAGRRAKANHEGSFVWADSQNADFASTDHDQVRIRATNGVHLVAPKLVLEDFGPAFELRSTAGDSSGMMSYLPYNLWTGPPSILFSIKDSQVMRLYEQTNGVGGMDVYGPVSATAFNPFSDRNMKENFAPVEAQAVLDKVIALPISRWNFKGDTATPHVGPMAQDFHAAFQTGSDDKHIATV